MTTILFYARMACGAAILAICLANLLFDAGW